VVQEAVVQDQLRQIADRLPWLEVEVVAVVVVVVVEEEEEEKEKEEHFEDAPEEGAVVLGLIDSGERSGVAVAEQAEQVEDLLVWKVEEEDGEKWSLGEPRAGWSAVVA